MNIDYDVDESGKDPVENAIIKASEYNKLSGLPTIALDEGLFLENIPDDIQPGTHVRRVNGKRLDGKEMIEYYLELVNQYGQEGELKGYFLKGVAIVDKDNIYTFDYKANRTFSNKKSEVIVEGYPLASIQIITLLNKFKSELTEEEERFTVDIEQQDILKFILDTIKKIEMNMNKKLIK